MISFRHAVRGALVGTLVSLLLLPLAACDAVAPSSAPTDEVAPPAAFRMAATTFTLALGESHAMVRGPVVTFEEVLYDRRCPIGLTCPWEGRAKARFAVSADGRTQRVDIEIEGGFQGQLPVGEARFAFAAGHALYFLRLEPYPDVNAKPGGVPVATLAVQRCGGRCGNDS